MTHEDNPLGLLFAVLDNGDVVSYDCCCELAFDYEESGLELLGCGIKVTPDAKPIEQLKRHAFYRRVTREVSKEEKTVSHRYNVIQDWSN